MPDESNKPVEAEEPEDAGEDHGVDPELLEVFEIQEYQRKTGQPVIGEDA